MLNHTMIGSNDIQRTKTFYDAVLGVLGAGPAMEHVNDTGQTRLFYIHDGSTFGISEPINGEPPPLPMALPLVSSATHQNSCRHSTMRPLPMAAPLRKIRRAYVRVPWALCTCATSLTQTVTRSAVSTVRLDHPKRSLDRSRRRIEMRRRLSTII